MSVFKRVLIIAANVHDGEGGEHKKGERPVLPAAIADLFIAKKMAVPEQDLSPAEAKRLDQERRDALHQAEQKGRAVSQMKMHDSKPADVRLQEAFPDEADKAPPVKGHAKGKPSRRTLKLSNGSNGHETPPRLRS